MRSMEERYWAKVTKGDGCWIWTGARNTAGYGKLNVEGRFLQAHRLALELATGHAPVGWVLHSCDNPSCVNPDHLREGNPSDNTKDCLTHGRHGMAKKTHCKHGHPFDEANTYYRPDRPNSRTCRTCNNAASLRYYPKRGRPW